MKKISLLLVWICCMVGSIDSFGQKAALNKLLLGAFFDDAEWHQDFTQKDLTGWITVDRDKLAPFGPFQEYPSKGAPFAWMIYNPEKTTPQNTFDYFAPRAGSKYFISISPSDAASNDWLITQELAPHNGGSFSFYGKNSLDFFGEEKCKVLYSLTDTLPSSFTVLGSVNAVAAKWTKYTYNVPAGAKHIAIQGVSTAFALLVDDIEWAPTLSPTAPASPTETTTQITFNTQTQVKIKWSNPSTEIGGSPLTTLPGVRIYRGTHPMNYELIHTLSNPTPGTLSEYTDVLPAYGFYTYRIEPFNGSGNGRFATLPMHYYGKETVPGKAKNIRFSRNGSNQTVISWDAVTFGELGGGLIHPVSSYTVRRSIGQDTVIIGTVATPSIVETSIPTKNFYTYDITANVSAQIAGQPAIVSIISGLSSSEQIVNLGAKDSDQPFQVDKTSFITQSIYPVQEMGSTGLIKGISYFSNIENESLSATGYKIYLSQTARNTFGNTQSSLIWEFYGNQKLVFDGEISFPKGRKSIDIVFDQPFFFDSISGRNLIVTIIKPLAGGNNVMQTKFLSTPITNYRTYYAVGYNTDMSIITMQPASWQTNEILSVPTIVVNKSFSYRSLNGQITSSFNGTPIANAEIEIYPADPSAYQKEKVKTDSNGNYSVSALMNGNYKIKVSAIGYKIQEDVISVVSGSGAMTKNLSMEITAPIAIEGKIIDAASQPISHASIRLTGYSQATAVSDESGRFTIAAYAGSHYGITVTHPLFKSSERTFVSENNSYTINDIVLSLQPIAPSHLQLSAQDNQVQIAWDAPEGLDKRTFLAWGSQTNTNNAWGAGGTEFTAGVKFLPSDMATLPIGSKLTQVKAYIANNASIDIEVYEGSNAAKLIYSQPETITQKGWYTFDLQRHIPIDPSKEFWIAIRFSVGYGAYPMGIDEGPNAAGNKGSMCKENGKWTGMSLTNKNWNLYGIAHTTVPATPSQYQIYRSTQTNPYQWQLMGNSSTPSFRDNTLSSQSFGRYYYGVSALYGDSTSAKVIGLIDVNMHFDLTVNIKPNAGNGIGLFVRMRNNQQVRERFCTQNDSVIFSDVSRGSYSIETIGGRFEHWQDSIHVQTSATVDVPLKEVLARPCNLNVSPTGSTSDSYLLSWNNSHLYSEGFENYKDFEKNTISDYTLLDIDNGNTYSFSNFTFPGAGSKVAFMVFNQESTTPPIVMPSYKGRRHAIALASEGVANNDWMILPTTEGAFRFQARSLINTELETISVLYSKTGTATTDFIRLHQDLSLTIPATWTEFNYLLPEGTKYVAINYLSNEQYAVLIDEIQFEKLYTHATGYNLYLNGIAQGSVTSPTTTLTMPKGVNTVEIEALYNSGTSEKRSFVIDTENGLESTHFSGPILYPLPAKDLLFIQSETPVEKVEIYNMAGALISIDQPINGSIPVHHLSSGIYTIRLLVENGELFTKKISIR